MVAYKPPDRVVLMIGGSFRGAPLVQGALRLAALAAVDQAALEPHGIPTDTSATLRAEADELQRMFTDPVIKKHDTPLPMTEVAEIMARVRNWLREMRAIAMVNLSLDAPSLARVFSSSPEVADGYARDLLSELEVRVKAARDLKARVEDVGLTEKFLGLGNKLAQQLRTAIGKEDVDPANLHFQTRRYYMKKGTLFISAKRVVRAGRYALRADPDRVALYHLHELEPDGP